MEKAISMGFEVGAVGRQEQDAGACGLDSFSDGDGLVAGRLSRMTMSPGLRVGARTCFDIGKEGCPGHRPIDGHGGEDAVEREAGDQSGGLPVTMGDGSAATLAPGSPAIHAGHLGRGPAFVDEDQALGVEPGLVFEPGLTPACDVRSVLLGSVGRLFLRVMPRRLKNPCTTLGGGR